MQSLRFCSDRLVYYIACLLTAYFRACAQAVAGALRSGAARAEKIAVKLATPVTASQKMHRALIDKGNRVEDVLRISEGVLQ